MPESFKELYKRQRHVSKSDAYSDGNILKPSDPASFTRFSIACHRGVRSANQQYTIINVAHLPGFKILSNYLTPQEQQNLVVDTIEQYIPPCEHLSNLTPHYVMPQRLELFGDQEIASRIPTKKATNSQQIRDKLLRWVTLGGQYDWTNKVYPSFEPGSKDCPFFPKTLAALVADFDVVPEAAIINLYSPGDTLSPHQDVAEKSDKELVAITIGCDCIFYAAASKDDEPLQILLSSGDIIVMSGLSRKAFHGVGKVWADSSPGFLGPRWHAQYGEWMRNKRINFSIRQMR